MGQADASGSPRGPRAAARWCRRRRGPAAARARPRAAARRRRRSPARRRLGRPLHRRSAGRRRSGGPRPLRTAATSSPRSAGRSRPSTRTRWLGQQAEPRRVAAQDDDRRAQPVRPAAGGQPLDAHPGDDQRRRARLRSPAARRGSSSSTASTCDGRLAGGQLGERSAGARPDVQAGDDRGRRSAAAAPPQRRAPGRPVAHSSRPTATTAAARPSAEQHGRRAAPALPGDQPRGERRRDEPQVDAGRRPRAAPARQTVDLGLEVGELRLPDALHLAQLVDAAEAAVLGAPVDDALRQHRPDARQGLEVAGGGGVEVEQAAGGGRRSGTARRRRDADEHLLAVDQPAREVQQRDVGAASSGPPAARDRVVHAGPAGRRTSPGARTSPPTLTTTSPDGLGDGLAPGSGTPAASTPTAGRGTSCGRPRSTTSAATAAATSATTTSAAAPPRPGSSRQRSACRPGGRGAPLHEGAGLRSPGGATCRAAPSSTATVRTGAAASRLVRLRRQHPAARRDQQPAHPAGRAVAVGAGSQRHGADARDAAAAPGGPGAELWTTCGCGRRYGPGPTTKEDRWPR